MRLGKYLTSMTMPELDKIKKELNLTEDEERVFNLLMKGKSITYISTVCLMSTSTVSNRVKDIKKKVRKVEDIVE